MKKLILLALIIGIASCDDNVTPEECMEDLLCTDQFEIIAFTPQDKNNNLIRLDSTYSINLETGQHYSFESVTDEDPQQIFIVLTDAQMEDVQREGSRIRFVGIRNREVVLEEDFLIGHDCCHVVKLQGPDFDD